MPVHPALPMHTHLTRLDTFAFTSLTMKMPLNSRNDTPLQTLLPDNCPSATSLNCTAAPVPTGSMPTNGLKQHPSAVLASAKLLNGRQLVYWRHAMA